MIDRNQFDRDFERTRRDFDKSFNRMTRFAVVVWLLAAAVTLGFLGVIAWAIVNLVQHYT